MAREEQLKLRASGRPNKGILKGRLAVFDDSAKATSPGDGIFGDCLVYFML